MNGYGFPSDTFQMSGAQPWLAPYETFSTGGDVLKTGGYVGHGGSSNSAKLPPRTTGEKGGVDDWV